jgi:chromosome segregation ATPase
MQKARSQKAKHRPSPAVPAEPSETSASGLASHWRKMPTAASSVASAARQASLSELVKSVARGEFHGSVLKAELGGTEAEVACLHDALRAASGMVGLNERAATEQRAELQLHQRLAEKLQAELHAVEHERNALDERLAGAQSKNKAWEERVETVTAEFEERTRQWQNELRTEGAKWQQHTLALTGKLSVAQAHALAQAAQVQEANEQRDAAVAACEQQLRAEQRVAAHADALKQALEDAKASLQRGWAAWAAREAEVAEARKEAAENARRADEKAEALAAAQGALEMRGNELGATRDRIREVEAAVAAVVKAQSEVSVSVEVASETLQHSQSRLEERANPNPKP